MIENWKRVMTERYASFGGRADRSEFWWFYLANVLLGVVLIAMIFVGFVISDVVGALLAVLFVAYSIALIMPTLAVGARRLHDTDRTGWWLLLYGVPIGGIVLIVLWAMQGTTGPNRYGPPPDAAG